MGCGSRNQWCMFGCMSAFSTVWCVLSVSKTAINNNYNETTWLDAGETGSSAATRTAACRGLFISHLAPLACGQVPLSDLGTLAMCSRLLDVKAAPPTQGPANNTAHSTALIPRSSGAVTHSIKQVLFLISFSVVVLVQFVCLEFHYIFQDTY